MAQIPTMRRAFRRDLLGHGGDDRRYLVRLIDTLRKSTAGAAGEERKREAQNMTEGGLNEIGLDGAGDGGALEVRGQGKVVAKYADGEE